ncbi:ABC transporter permease [Acetobacterium sp.]|uniref:ABC transporter permease n=1 Tax=Acetobacterium sp. TaxID=1872094 RepID=UPI0027221796|nr:ABC transporter permease [Acetobacterium sp.]MDO9492351.1 ABC transporter permease [Acetobacterium sp.]
MTVIAKKIKAAWMLVKDFSFQGKLSTVILILIILMAIFATSLSPYPYNFTSGDALIPPDSEHIMGTDDLGIDLWAQICYGARISLIIGFGTALLAAVGGGLIGMFSGYVGGIPDKIIMRTIDVLIVIPDFPLMVLLAALLGPSLLNVVIVLTLFAWVTPARIVRSQVLMLKEQTYIKAAETYGAGSGYLIGRHFLPAVFPILAVNIIRLTGRAIISEAGLSFLGLGDPTSKSWGLIIHYATSFKGIYYTNFWKWWLVFPWLMLTMVVMALAFLSREMERVLDPQIRIRV